MGWTETLLGRTRAEILRLLRRGRRSINDLAAALGITDNAVRTHVAAMQLDGMVRSAGVERGTGGKPAQLYEITPAAEDLFPKAYALVLTELLSLLEERHGREQVIALLREVGTRAAGAGRRVVGYDEARVQAAADILRSIGGDVEVLRERDFWRIRGHGCPLSGVVAEHHEVCSLAEALVGEVTGLPVTECCDRGERPRCAFMVGSPHPFDPAA